MPHWHPHTQGAPYLVECCIMATLKFCMVFEQMFHFVMSLGYQLGCLKLWHSLRSPSKRTPTVYFVKNARHIFCAQRVRKQGTHSHLIFHGCSLITMSIALSSEWAKRRGQGLDKRKETVIVPPHVVAFGLLNDVNTATGLPHFSRVFASHAQ